MPHSYSIVPSIDVACCISKGNQSSMVGNILDCHSISSVQKSHIKASIISSVFHIIFLISSSETIGHTMSDMSELVELSLKFNTVI